MAGTIVVSNLNDGTNTGNTTDMIKGSARAWVNFNGTGTVAIRAAYNVSSITDNGVGNYTVNFTNAMQDANYVASGLSNVTLNNVSVVNINTIAINSFMIYTYNTASTVTVDREIVHVSIFR